MTGKVKIAVLIFFLTVTAPVMSFAEENGNWEFNLAPLYLWAIAIDGDMGVGGRTSSVDVNFDDIWDNLEGVFTLRFNGMYKNKFGFIFDYNYLDLGTERASDAVNFSVGFKSQIVNLAGTYRFLDGPHVLDAVGGIRYTILDAEIDLRNVGTKLDGDQDWVDPIVGLGYTYQFNDQWSIRLYGDVGGFGVSSDFTWQALGLIDFQPWKHVAIVAGYRGIGTEYETGSGTDEFTYDATVHGPVVGIDIRW